MIKIEKTNVYGWEAAIHGMRNPMNSWDKSDSIFDGGKWCLGKKDHELMQKLAMNGSVHAKYRRMINVTCNITAPLYWWKEFDTYKVGTVANSCSTMHKIAEKEFTLDDFSHEQLIDYDKHAENEIEYPAYIGCSSLVCGGVQLMNVIIDSLNFYRSKFLETNDKKYWWQMIQLIPSSYHQKRTILLNYEVLGHIYPDRKSHKLNEWIEFCKWIKTLPYSEVIIGD